MLAPVSPIRLCHLFRRFYCEPVGHPYVLIVSSIFGWSCSMIEMLTFIETACFLHLSYGELCGFLRKSTQVIVLEFINSKTIR